MEERDRRAEILQAAQKVFSQYGYHQATIRAIVEEANCAAGTFYLYFASKEDCFLALMDKLYRNIMEQILGARRQVMKPADKLRQSFWAVVEGLSHDTELTSVVLVRAAGANPMFEERLWRVRDAFAEFIVEDLVESGLTPSRAAIGAHACVGALAETVGVWVRSSEPESALMAAFEEIEHIFWLGWGLSQSEGVESKGYGN
ncbi:MAG: TetR/AcrR family transcriptional regulator [Sulfobacillus benefaciens]|uniref:TetR/AcrR family transcriptional regulator n=1 Tax=Sulfobacillus benefaciens TaxID=453960 RepID=A0A2T2XFY4_9FIRM|nr:MAG: TetR/AcrR family transcriptional regulator [Sulfobacillus benefaciens]